MAITKECSGKCWYGEWRFWFKKTFNYCVFSLTISFWCVLRREWTQSPNRAGETNKPNMTEATVHACRILDGIRSGLFMSVVASLPTNVQSKVNGKLWRIMALRAIGEEIPSFSNERISNFIISGNGANRNINATANGWFVDDSCANVNISALPNLEWIGS